MASRIRFKFLLSRQSWTATWPPVSSESFISLAVVTVLYVTVDFFDRIGTLLDSGASISSILRYFFYKSPLLISRAIGSRYAFFHSILPRHLGPNP